MKKHTFVLFAVIAIAVTFVVKLFNSDCDDLI